MSGPDRRSYARQARRTSVNSNNDAAGLGGWPIDQPTRDVLVLILGAVLGLSSAVIVGGITSRDQRRLERDRWKREMYAEFLRLTDVMRGGTERGTRRTAAERIAARDRALQLVFEIEMIQPEMFTATAEVWEPAKSIVETEVGLANDEGELDQLRDQYLDAWMAFKTAAAKDLKP